MNDARRDEALEALADIEGHLEEVWHGIRHSDHIHDQLMAIKHLLAEPEPPEKTPTTVTMRPVADQYQTVNAFARQPGGRKLFTALPVRRGAVVSVTYPIFPDVLRGVGRIDIDAPLAVRSHARPGLNGACLELPGKKRHQDGRTPEWVYDGDNPLANVKFATDYYNDRLLATLKALADYIEANFRLAPEE